MIDWLLANVWLWPILVWAVYLAIVVPWMLWETLTTDWDDDDEDDCFCFRW